MKVILVKEADDVYQIHPKTKYKLEYLLPAQNQIIGYY